MIILDTNVISEAIKPKPDPTVQTWLNRQPAQTLYLTSISVAELMYGVAVLPNGKRKRNLTQILDGLFGIFETRTLPFDNQAARHYAALAATARRAGRGFPTPDGYIAAIAAAHKFIVATRDVGPFLATGISVIDPWHG